MAALSEHEVLELLRETGALLDGHFLLSSGLHSPRYIQCARLLQHPKLASLACTALADKARGLGPADVVVGPALGGVLVAHELARALGVRGMFTEREEGKMVLRRGFEIRPGERVLLAEDVVTTGRSSGEVAEAVQAQGGEIVGVACIVDRREEKTTLAFPLVTLVRLHIETYPAKDCPLCHQGVPCVKPGSRPQGS